MKILFSADWHIRLVPKNVPRDWAHNRYAILFKEFDRVYKEYNCDLEIQGGDIFDKAPTVEELSLYLNYLGQRKGRKILIFDGNHEATKKGHTFFSYLKDTIPLFNPEAELISAPGNHYGVDIIPYTHIKTFNPKDFNADILCTHVRGDIPPHVKSEIDLNKLSRWKKVFAGDLHSHSNCQRNIIYPGSPVSVTFHRSKVETGVVVFDSETADFEWVKLNVPQLIRKTVSSEEEIIKTKYDHTIYEITGNALDLSKINKDQDLLDKKIVHNTSEATLNLTNMTLEEELQMYLKEILSLNPEQIEDVMRVYSDYS